ncbi:nucleic acid-binding, OB-fold protein [Tanacetum coccineum]
MTFPGLPPHELELKVVSPIMLLRNVNLSGGLCNRTRMIVRSRMSKLIEAQIIIGTRIEKHKCPALSITVLAQRRQFRTMSAATIASLRIGQENCILEAKVYRRWISKSVPDMKALAYCCILIDRENNAIQATMDINNIDYFSQLLQPHAAYRISNFICERTKPYQQTLENQITLRFGKITLFEPLPGKESEFPDHHFELISYYQLPSRVPYRDENSKLIYPILTDYLGCVRSISDIIPFGTPTTSEKYLRKVDIEDLDQYTNTDVQLSATPATHYYINPQTTKSQRVYTVFKEKYNSNPPLQIAKYRCQDPKEEKIRNKQTLHTLLEQNPTTFKGVHFTYEGMITSVQENRDWKYPSCSECSKALTQQNGTYICEDHGRQDPVTYRDSQHHRQKHIFQIRYTPLTQRGVGAFIADDVLDNQPAIQTEDAGDNDS